MDTKLLAGTVALITDSSSAVGAAIGRRLAAEGAAVGLVARRRDVLERLVGQIEFDDGLAHAFEADLTDPDQADRAVQDTLDRFDRLDILVNNALILLPGTALHTTVEEWDRMVALNVGALLHVTHAAVPYLMDAVATSARRVADIVTVCSAAGLGAGAASSAYSLTHFGRIGFTEALRRELSDEHIRVSLVEQDTVTTERADHRDDDTRRPAAGRTEPPNPTRVADAIGEITIGRGPAG